MMAGKTYCTVQSSYGGGVQTDIITLVSNDTDDQRDRPPKITFPTLELAEEAGNALLSAVAAARAARHAAEASTP